MLALGTVGKTYSNGVHALDGVSLQVAPGEIVAVVGASGCGKSTLLRLVCGLDQPSQGRIVLDGTPISGPHEQIGIVFQEPRLLPWLTVAGNVGFGLADRPRGERRDRVAAALDRVGLSDKAEVWPRELSGGQAQRVALARALATEPAVLLLDEPLAAVDAAARAELRLVLHSELGRYPGTRLVVTHDPVEAATLADRLIVLEEGRITQHGPLVEVTARPRSPWVATMVGLNLLSGMADHNAVRLANGAVVATVTTAQGPTFVAIRPNAVALHREPPEGSARNVWPGQASELYLAGDRARVRITGPVPLIAEVTPAAVAALHLADGGNIWASVKATDIDTYPD
jgi:molybdate transport system ATP-binding protein